MVYADVIFNIMLSNRTFFFTVLLALQSWIKQQHAKFIYFSAAAIIIFRAELAMFLGILLLIELVNQRIHPLK
jgi:alpha-1,6-mannosyltransferase